MVDIITAEIMQTSLGEELPIPVTVSAISAYTIGCTAPTSMITDIYIGRELEIVSCAADSSYNGKRYLIIDNTDNDIVINATLSGTLAAADVCRIRPYGAGPINTLTALDTDTVIGVLPTADYPDPDYNQERYFTSGGTREPHIIIRKEIKHSGSLPIKLQNGRILKFLLGNLYETGADKAGGGGSQLNGATAKWATSFAVDAATNYATGDYIQVDTSTNAEVRKITNVVTNTITVDLPLARAHADNATCNEVEAPYTHTMTVGDNPLPSFTLERGVDLATDWVTYYLGTVVSKGELSGDEKGELQSKLDILCSRSFKNINNAMSSLQLLQDDPYLIDTASFTYWSTPIARVKSFSLSIDNKIEEGIYWRQAGGPYALDMIAKECEAELTTTVVPFDSSIWDQLVAQAEVTCQIDFVRTTGSDTAQILCSNCKLKSAPHNQPEHGEVEVEIVVVPKTIQLQFVDSIYHY